MNSQIRPSLNNRKIIVACSLAVVAALATCGIVQAKYPFFSVSDEFSIGMGASIEARQALSAEQSRADRLNAAVILAIGGALLASVLAISASRCCWLPLRLLVAIPWGAIWGALTGFVGAIAFAAVMPKEALPSPTNIAMAQAIVFAMLGTGLGLLFGIFSRNRKIIATSVMGSAIAGALGGILFPIVAGLVMANQSTVDLMPASTMARPLWLGLPFAAIAGVLPAMCNKAPQVETPPPVQDAVEA